MLRKHIQHVLTDCPVEYAAGIHYWRQEACGKVWLPLHTQKYLGVNSKSKFFNTSRYYVMWRNARLLVVMMCQWTNGSCRGLCLVRNVPTAVTLLKLGEVVKSALFEKLEAIIGSSLPCVDVSAVEQTFVKSTHHSVVRVDAVSFWYIIKSILTK